MATLMERIGSLITAMKAEIKAIRTMISGSDTGGVSGLATTATDLVGAFNEVKATADSSVQINDLATNTTEAWSGNKVNTEIGLQVTSGVAAALEGEDLSDLAAQVTANAQADNGFVSFAGAQTLSAAEITQFNANTGIGEPDTDLVALWNAA